MAGRRTALIVANDVYEHEGLGRLRSPAADAEALAGVLGDPAIGGFEVEVVRNEAAHVIEGRIEDLFADARLDDVLLLHFSCHGLKSESGELFLAATNTRPNRLASTAVSADFVQRCLRMSRSRSIVLLLDCCYGGAFSTGVTVRAAGDANVLDSFAGGRLGGGRGRAVITASSATEYAFEGDRLADDHSSPSVFTSALVEGLASGEADLDQDGWVSLNELYDYVFDRVREQNPQQTPSRDVEMQGELYVARRSHPVTEPAPLPPELLQMIDSPMATLRVGAVAELVGLLQGRNAGLKLAAKATLERLTEDDSRSVAAAAAAALGLVGPEAQPQAPPAAVGTAPEPQVSPESKMATATAARESESGHGAGNASAPRRWWTGWSRRRRWVALATASVIVAAGIVFAVQLSGDGNPPAGGSAGNPSGGGSAGGEFTESAPWRVKMDGTRVAGGCTITVTNADTGAEIASYQNVSNARSYQIQDTGKFRLTVNDLACKVTHTAGSGETALPFVGFAGTGDTDAFTVPNGKRAVVKVKNFNSYGSCLFTLRDPADGRDLDFDTVYPTNGTTTLNPQGSNKVYLAEFDGCDIDIRLG
jgi:hypothetical protein